MTQQEKLNLKSQPWTAYSQNIASLNISKKTKDNINDIIKVSYVADDITYEMLGSRKRKIVENNMVLAKVIHEFFRLSITAVGNIFGKHHASIIHYINVYENSLYRDSDCAELYSMLCDYTIDKLYGVKADMSVVDTDRLNNIQLRKLVQELRVKNEDLEYKLANIKNAIHA